MLNKLHPNLNKQSGSRLIILFFPRQSLIQFRILQSIQFSIITRPCLVFYFTVLLEVLQFFPPPPPPAAIPPIKKYLNNVEMFWLICDVLCPLQWYYWQILGGLGNTQLFFLIFEHLCQDVSSNMSIVFIFCRLARHCSVCWDHLSDVSVPTPQSLRLQKCLLLC